MTWTGRGDPSLTDAVPGTRGQRQGSVSSRELLGLQPARPRGPWRGLVFLVVLMLVIVVGGIVVAGPKVRDSAYDLARSNPQVMRLPLVPDIVRERLGASIDTPAGTRATPVKFTIDGGETVGQVGRALAAQGLISDQLIFSYLAITQGADDKLHTGSFRLDPTMTPQQILTRLQSPPDPETTKVLLSLKPGLRLEQITAYLETRPVDMDPADFYAIVHSPPAWVRAEFPWLKVLPEGRSLEGFMGLGNVTVDANITPEDLVRTLLTRWETSVGPAVIADVQQKGRDFYNTLTLASIVQKEVRDYGEAALVAGVYANRLKGGGETAGLLQADPTVSYAVDTDKLSKMELPAWKDYSFFSPVKGQASKKVSSAMQSYQTYTSQGLPDGPIDSPSLAAIEAAANPDTRDGYYYFVACSGDTTHRFATTARQHAANIKKCK